MDVVGKGFSSKGWTSPATASARDSDLESLKETFGPLHDISSLSGKTVADIGAGTGAVVNSVLDLGARRVIAIEPTASFKTLCEKVRPRLHRVVAINGDGDEIAQFSNVDFICSIGFVDRVPHPDRLIKAIWKALKPGGTLLITLASCDNKRASRFRLSLANQQRAWLSSLPERAVKLLVVAAAPLLTFFLFLSRLLPVPRHSSTWTRIEPGVTVQLHRLLYEELNPRLAACYTRQEAVALLADHGFINVRIYTRNSRTWTISGDRPLGTVPQLRRKTDS